MDVIVLKANNKFNATNLFDQPSVQLLDISIIFCIKMKTLIEKFQKWKVSSRCPVDKKMFRRQYQKPLTQLRMPHHYIGFSNRILIQQPDKKTQNYFIPVYIEFKIKSIQEIDIQRLMGIMNCVITIYVMIENLPDPLVYLLQTQMKIQLNRTELIQLKDDFQNNISVIKSDKMLKFTIRKNVTGTIPSSIVQETLWSPFQYFKLIASITFNSIRKGGLEIHHNYYEHLANEKKKVTEMSVAIIQELGKMFVPQAKKKEQKQKQKQKPTIQFDNSKIYSINFNCMRNGSQIPISYDLGCVYLLYDLAQKRLESYHTNLDSYSQVIRQFQGHRQLQIETQRTSKSKRFATNAFKDTQGNILAVNESGENKKQLIYRQGIFMQKLSEYVDQIYDLNTNDKKKNLNKAKPYQYSHFVIPLYKYPGNSLATMFIPIFLLALLSLAIFFQDNQLSDRIGSIAAMMLGYIALIPSVKEQLPPSSRITIVQRVIYLQTLCCLFSLIQSFRIDDDAAYVFIWHQNELFLFCLFIHVSVFIFIASLLIMHKLKWQPSYNNDKYVNTPNPERETHAWINVYCDQQFYKANSKIYEMFKQHKRADHSKMFIRKYEPKYKEVQEISLEAGPYKDLFTAKVSPPKEQQGGQLGFNILGLGAYSFEEPSPLLKKEHEIQQQNQIDQESKQLIPERQQGSDIKSNSNIIQDQKSDRKEDQGKIQEVETINLTQFKFEKQTSNIQEGLARFNTLDDHEIRQRYHSTQGNEEIEKQNGQRFEISFKRQSSMRQLQRKPEKYDDKIERRRQRSKRHTLNLKHQSSLAQLDKLINQGFHIICIEQQQPMKNFAKAKMKTY